MNNLETNLLEAGPNRKVWPIIDVDDGRAYRRPDIQFRVCGNDRWPILYEDDDEGEMGETNIHVVSDEILHVCLLAHLANRPELRVYANMNLYYQLPDGEPVKPTPNVSPDLMVVEPDEPSDRISSYEIDRDGPVPILVGEILSARTAQQRDLDEKMEVYRLLGIREYLLVDIDGRFLPERLLLKRLQPDGTWADEPDQGSGVTSELGFRVTIESNGWPRLSHAQTGFRYPLPYEAYGEALARHQAEARAREAERLRLAEVAARQEAEAKTRELEAEIARLKSLLPPEGSK